MEVLPGTELPRNHQRTRVVHMSSCMVQVWELFGSFLANESFAHEMDMSLAPANESAIPHVESNPKLRDGFQKPVRAATSLPIAMPHS